jgi:lipopolysaccharide biosynthesis glycosyltransferase
MPENTIHVAFTIDDRYAKFLSVTLASILSSAGDNDNLIFYILSDYISDENKRKLDQLAVIKNFEINHIKINADKYKNLPAPVQSHMSISTLYRIEVPSLLPFLDKIIFLDAGDLCVLTSLSGIWNINIDDYYMASVHDQQPFMYGDYLLALPLDRSKRTFNIGVQLINLRKWREDKIERMLFNAIAKYYSILELPDQDAMNIVLSGKIFPLPHKWNAMPWQIYALDSEKTEAFSDTCIMHWAGWEKPWIFPHAKYAEIFFKYARMTPFYEEIIFENFRFGELYHRSDRQRADFEAQRNRQLWFLQKLRGFKTCWKDHGLLYTIGLFVKKCLRRFKKG